MSNIIMAGIIMFVLANLFFVLYMNTGIKRLYMLLWLFLSILVGLSCINMFLTLDAEIARGITFALFSAACGPLLFSVVKGLFSNKENKWSIVRKHIQ